MPRRSRPSNPEALRSRLTQLLNNFQQELLHDDLRRKVVKLVPAFHALRDLGCSLMGADGVVSARERIVLYFRKYPRQVLDGDELMVVSGIGEWARRLRQLRVQHGWRIASGVTLQETIQEEGPEALEALGVAKIKPDQYILLDEEQDRELAFRWNVANEIRKKNLSVQNKILEFFRRNVGKPVTNEELRYVANNRSEWARRVRELRTEEGWPIATKTTGRPDLPVGVYVLPIDRQEQMHDRNIPDAVRGRVLRRDRFACQECGWTQEQWHPADPRFLELHHLRHHVDRGENVEANLVTLCNVCHDMRHSRDA